MKAFDANLDRSSRDNGFDLLASRSLSREMQETVRTQFSERQKLTVASNYFALACPIMPVGLLGAFMLLDRIANNPEDELQPKKIDAQQLAREQEASTQAVLASAMKQKMEIEKRKTPLSCSRPIDGLAAVSDKRPANKKRAEGSILPEGKQTARIGGPQLLSRAQQDVGKLVKQKAAMQAHLEKYAQEQDYHSVCRVSAQLELLDKALKKLGA